MRNSWAARALRITSAVPQYPSRRVRGPGPRLESGIPVGHYEGFCKISLIIALNWRQQVPVESVARYIARGVKFFILSFVKFHFAKHQIPANLFKLFK